MKMKHQIIKLWGACPVLSTSLTGLVEATFNDRLTANAIQAFDRYTASSWRTGSEEPVPFAGTGRRRRRRPRSPQGGAVPSATAAIDNNVDPAKDSLTPNDNFFEHQRTRGYRLATPSISSCDCAKRLEEDYIPDAVAYYLEALGAKTLARHLSLGGGGELSIDMWAAVQRGPGAHHKMHVHEGSIVSGVYYCAVPPGSAPLVLQKPADLPLLDGEDQTHSNEKGDVIVSPTEGQMILFPPWLLHGVPEAKDSAAGAGVGLPRVSYAFNLTGRLATIGDPWDVTRAVSSVRR